MRTPRWPVKLIGWERWLEPARRALTAEAIAAAEAAARVLTIEKAVEDALAVHDPTATPDDPLTWRERQVVSLIVRGCSNRQIAQELVIAVSTAERNVANILGKLNLASRTSAGCVGE